MTVQSVRENPETNAMTIVLVTFNKSGKRKEFPIHAGTTVIGRKTDADLRIPLNEISRAHCEISIQKEEIIVRDLDSSNGTFVNDEQVTEATLRAGDRLRLGPIVFVLQINGEPKEILPPMKYSEAAVSLTDDQLSDSATTLAATPVEDDEIDIDNLEDIDKLDVDDFSDLDLDDVEDLEGGDELDVIDDLEEISEDDGLIDDEEDS